MPRLRTIFFGSPEFAVPSLLRVAQDSDLVAVVTQPDRPAGRGQDLAEPAVKRAARGLSPPPPVLQPEKIRTAEFEATLRGFAADLFVVVAYGRILPQSILDLPARGPFNVHASLLPRLRGAAPIQWSIMNGDRETGVTIMRMEAGLDTGPVAAQRATPIADDDTTETLGRRLSLLGAELFAATLPAIGDGSIVLARQDDAAATLAPILRKEDGRLSFETTARAVSCRARGVDPWPGATALLDGQVVKLFGPRLLGGAGAGTPGTVVAIDAQGLSVACADGAVTFAEVQMPGRKRLPAAAVAAGRAIAVGARFG
ncbi:MAG TPA: methionyl-tRNA formyltransferase [Polyangia bacterium]|jgi:methionyl-tRNA formyltransferase|nr:methionyl-tRNA formyltransferase [Polyangia bacterium]